MADVEDIMARVAELIASIGPDSLASADKVGIFTTVLNKLGVSAGEAAAHLTGLGASAGAASSGLDKLRAGSPDLASLATSAKSLASNMGEFGFNVVPVANAFLKFLPDASAQFASLTKSGEVSFGSLTEAMKESGAGIAKLGGNIPLLGRLSAPMLAFATALAESAEPGRQLEGGVLRMAAASGNFGSVIRAVGTDLSGLTDLTNTYASAIGSTAFETGLAPKQIDQYANALRQIPGAIGRQIPLTEGAAASTDLMTAALKMAAGTGQDYDKVMGRLTEMYLNFNTTGYKAVSQLAQIGRAATDLGLPLEMVSEFTKGAAEKFVIFGDNTRAAVDILSKFSDPLTKLGVAPRVVESLASKFVSGIKDMDISQKAFLATQAGMEGGLGGAFEIDLMLQQGKMDEVGAMIMDTLQKQLGGGIVTLEEVVADKSLSGQMMKQVQFLTEGPFGKMAESPEAAYRMLDAMKAGRMGEVAPTTTAPEMALKESVDIGNTILERNTTVLNQIHTLMATTSAHASTTMSGMARTMIGVEGSFGPLIDATRERGAVLPVGAQGVLSGTPPISKDELYKTMEAFAIGNTGLMKEGATGMIDNLGKVLGPIFGEKVVGEMMAKLRGPEGEAGEKKPGAKQTIEGYMKGEAVTNRTVAAMLEAPTESILATGARSAADREALGTTALRTSPGVTGPDRPIPVKLDVSVLCTDCMKQVAGRVIEEYDTNTVGRSHGGG